MHCYNAPESTQGQDASGLCRHQIPASRIEISLKDQRLDMIRQHAQISSWPVSTARNGAGEQSGSEQTPRGWHVSAP